MEKNVEKFLLIFGLAAVAAVGSSFRISGSGTELPREVSVEASPVLTASVSQNAFEPASGPRPDAHAALRDSARRVPFYRVSDSPAPAVPAESALLADLETGEVYFDLKADKRWPMASVTKLLTASFVRDHVNEKSPVTLGNEAFTQLGGDVSKNLHPGESYLALDLVKAMLLFSSNEAAEALAASYGRTEFMNGLNQLATEWDLLETHLSDPTGLSPANQSTAYDLLKLTRKVSSLHPDLLEITTAKGGVLTELSTGKKLPVANINQFAGERGFLGGKTGYTDEARGNLVSVFEHGGRRVAIIVLGTDDRFGATAKLRAWFAANFRAGNI